MASKKPSNDQSDTVFFVLADTTLKRLSNYRRGVRFLNDHNAVMADRLAYLGMCVEMERFFRGVLEKINKDYQHVKSIHEQTWNEKAATRWVQHNWQKVQALSINREASLGFMWMKIKEDCPEIIHDLDPKIRDRFSNIVVKNRNALAHGDHMETEQSLQELFGLLTKVIIAFAPSLAGSALVL